MTEVRIHPSWHAAGGIALAIMQGKHDDELEAIASACSSRVKDRFRKGARYRLAGTRNVDIDGKECAVIKANQKSITIRVDESGVEYNVPPRMLEAIS